MVSSDKSILVIGPRYSSDLSKAGGTLVLFEQFIQDLEYEGIKYKAISSNTQSYKNSLHALAVVMFEFFTNFLKYDHISLHGTANHYILMAPIVVFFSKMFGKSVSLRKFAGNFDDIYKKSSGIKKRLIRYVLKNSDINYFETKYLVDYFKQFNDKTYWFPNVRRRNTQRSDTKEYGKKFAFISLVSYEKGMDELLEVAKKLDDSYSVNIYGTIHEDKYTKEYINSFSATYHGALKPDEVLKVIKDSDVIVLPSYREGYPGIILESFSVGIPVLTTSLKAITEIVKNGKNGILVEPKNVDSLYDGFVAFDKVDYKDMCDNAFDSFELFDSIKQTKLFLEKI